MAKPPFPEPGLKPHNRSCLCRLAHVRLMLTLRRLHAAVTVTSGIRCVDYQAISVTPVGLRAQVSDTPNPLPASPRLTERG